MVGNASSFVCRSLIAGALTCSAILWGASDPAAAAPPLTVGINTCPGATVSGISGTHYNGAGNPMRQFWGIPYAAPPTGVNRWQPPQTQCWTGDIETFFAKPSCPQGNGAFSNEDCLYLNIFTPSTGGAGGNRPVLVYIHGGGLIAGSGTYQTNASALVARNVVVVTLNYRVGALGFLAHAAIDNPGGGNSGNYGLLDQRAALQWIRANISSFGGNPNNITVFGGSAGALSILTHLVSPLGAGLFERAIVQSGAFGWTGASNLATAESRGATFATNVACNTGTPTEIADCLRALPWQTVLANQGVLGQSSALITIDNYVLTDSIKALFVAGQFHHVPIINGSNMDEERFHLGTNASLGSGGSCAFNSNLAPDAKATFPGAVSYSNALNGFFGNTNGPLVEAQYPSGAGFVSANIAYTRARTDRTWACRFLRLTDVVAQNGGTIYAYEFRDRSAPQTLRGPMTAHGGATIPDGAYHGAEGQYLFQFAPGEMNPCQIAYPGLSANQQQLFDTMVKYWTRFAQNGSPNRAALADAPIWPSFTTTRRIMMGLEATATGPRRVNANGFDTYHKCSSFWFPLLGP